MRAVIQKVSCSRVDVLDGNHKETCAEIDNGLMILLGVTHDDTEVRCALHCRQSRQSAYFRRRCRQIEPVRQRCRRLNPAGLPIHIVCRCTKWPPPVFLGSRPCRTGANALSAYRRTIARTWFERANRPLPNAYAGQPVQRRPRYPAAGLAKTVLTKILLRNQKSIALTSYNPKVV